MIFDNRREMLAYVAGIIDGEGCIGINNTHTAGGGRGRRKYHHFLLRVEVASTSQELIKFLHKTFGGHFTTGKRPNRKPYYRWGLSSRMAVAFLREVYPFLLIKKPQADIAFKLRSSLQQTGRAISTDIIAFRRQCFEELRDLKRADGPVPPKVMIFRPQQEELFVQ